MKIEIRLLRLIEYYANEIKEFSSKFDTNRPWMIEGKTDPDVRNAKYLADRMMVFIDILIQAENGAKVIYSDENGFEVIDTKKINLWKQWLN